jgi:type IV pilus assembly protein PilY1
MVVTIGGMASLSHADDVDIYDLAHGVRPNILFVFDNSGSMSEGIPYDDTDVYPMVEPGNNRYETDAIYERDCVRRWWWMCLEWDWVEYYGPFTDADGDGIDDSDSDIRRGNRLNYDFSAASNKLEVAKDTIQEMIDLVKDYSRMGIMVLNGHVDINATLDFSAYHNDTTVLSSTYGGAPIEDRDDAGIETLKNQIDNMTANGGTPLGNRLINAAQYFRGDFGSWESPINQTYWCRRNFVILITDGRPEGEGNSLSANYSGQFDFIEDFLDANAEVRDYDGDSEDPDPYGNYINGGSDYLDDVAGYLYNEEDMRPDIEGTQNLTTYTIGFAIDHPLLGNAALNGGGNYYSAANADELNRALRHALATIIEKTQTFTAPVVPIHKTTSGNKMYISLFAPKQGSTFWAGYLAKLGIDNDGNIIDANGAPATDADGKLHEHLLDPGRDPNPYWETHNVMKNRDLSLRTIYTYLGSSLESFDTVNTGITDQMLGTPLKQATADPAASAREDVIRYIWGYDTYDEDEDGIYDEPREHVLGGILHSVPLVIDYSDTERVIYVGANDGMLHAFDDADGSERWAFVPPDLLPKLKEFAEGVGLQYFVDSSPKAYIFDNDSDGVIEIGDNDQVIIIFGERRGGTGYCALDVTDPDSPSFLWHINCDDGSAYGLPTPATVIPELGQTWSEPVIGRVKETGVDRIVACIGGGYSTDNTAGRALYLIDVFTGAVLLGFDSTDHAGLTYSMPTTVLAVDTNHNAYINRVYVGDLGGRMWRFGLHRTDENDVRQENSEITDWTARLLFESCPAAPGERKVFYPLDLVLERGYDYLYFGTGDRTDPMETVVDNRLYAVKDRNEMVSAFDAHGPRNETDLVDLTTNVLQQNPGSEEAELTSTNLDLLEGWYIQLEEPGEKVLASPVVIAGMVLFTTFSPTTDPCSYGGDARFYALGYRTGEAVLNLDTTNDPVEGDPALEKTDRSMLIGHGIPTEVVVTITPAGDVVGYVGTGEYVVKIDLNLRSTLQLHAWREVF